ncbi:sulfatase-like hydrolase/transferase, partial [Opitutaceae bacterium]|nr:sulfatase-like hydrolase/transferase [Opitutaceae bacterium]
MIRRPPFLLTFALILGVVTPLQQSVAADRPDIVFIIVDDLNDWIGALGGHPDAISPNIDRLASQGMLFTQAYCNSPQCRPSRTSL